MAEPGTGEEQAPKKKSKLPLVIGLVLMLGLGGGGFYAVYSGMILGDDQAKDHAKEEPIKVEALPDIAYVAVDPMVVTLTGNGNSRHLRFTAQLEVPKAYEQDVALLAPRILDVLNGYLRAVDVTELEDPTALVRLRAQMLRRVQIVSGEGRVRDLLVTEFVLN